MIDVAINNSLDIIIEENSSKEFENILQGKNKKKKIVFIVK